MILLLITDYCTYMYNLLHVQILQITTKIKMYIININNNYSCKNCISVLLNCVLYYYAQQVYY